MTKQELEKKCERKEQDLLEKYYGNLVKEAAIEKPETIGEYTKDLPHNIEEEYYQYLKELLKEICPGDSISLESIIDKKHLSSLMTENNREGISQAYEDATRRTLWERITQTNHKDVTFYKGLLKEYTRMLLMNLRCDFIEDVNNFCAKE